MGGRAHRRVQRPPLVRRLGQGLARPSRCRRATRSSPRSPVARPPTSSSATSRGRSRASTAGCSPTGTCTPSTSRATACRPGRSPAAARFALPRRRGRGGARRPAVRVRRADLRHRLPPRLPDALPVPRRHRGPPGLRRRPARQRPPGRRPRGRPGPHVLTGPASAHRCRRRACRPADGQGRSTARYAVCCLGLSPQLRGASGRASRLTSTSLARASAPRPRTSTRVWSPSASTGRARGRRRIAGPWAARHAQRARPAPPAPSG